MVHDQPRALEFYRTVFDYHVDDLSAPGLHRTRRSRTAPDRSPGSASTGRPRGTSQPAWTLYFAVTSTDDAAASV